MRSLFVFLSAVLLCQSVAEGQLRTYEFLGAYDVPNWNTVTSAWPTSGDGRMGPLDAQMGVLRYLNPQSSERTNAPTYPEGVLKFDVSTAIMRAQEEWANVGLPSLGPDAVMTTKDYRVSPLDALLVINALNRRPHRNPVINKNLDVDNNGSVSPRDLLLVVNYLNFRPVQSSEPPITNIMEPAASQTQINQSFYLGLVYKRKANAVYMDVNGDYLVTAADADAILQALNTR